MQGGGEIEVFIRQDRKRQMQSFGCFALIDGILRRQPEHLGNSQRLQVGKMIAKTARLRRATPRAGNVIPARRSIDARHSGARIDIKHSATFELRQVHPRIIGRKKPHPAA